MNNKPNNKFTIREIYGDDSDPDEIFWENQWLLDELERVTQENAVYQEPGWPFDSNSEDDDDPANAWKRA